MSSVAIELDASTYYPGDEVNGRVVVESDKRLKVNAIVLVAKGVETAAAVVSRDSVVEQKATVIDEVIDLAGKGSLPAGRNEYPFTIAVPTRAAPNIKLKKSTAEVEYELTARVDIPWAIDLRTRRPLRIGYDPEPYLQHCTSITKQSPCAKDDRFRDVYPWMELTVDKSHLVASEPVTGTVTVHNTAAKKVRGIDFVLERRVFQNAYGKKSTSGYPVEKWTLPADELVEAQPVPFKVWLPNDPRIAPTTYKGVLTGVHYRLKATLDIAWGFDEHCKIRLHIFR